MLPESALALHNLVKSRSAIASQVRGVALVAAEGRKAHHTITRKLIGIVEAAARDLAALNEEQIASKATIRAVVRRLAEDHGVTICDEYLRQWRR